MAEVILRPMTVGDTGELVRITAATEFFRPDEVVVAQEVLSEGAVKGEASGYHTLVAADGTQTLGYVCFGPIPLTQGAWDIYWIAVDPRHQGRGVGRRLMVRAEEAIGCQGGRLVLVETSSQALYEPTRGFYRSLGYREVSCIPDFYDVGDAKVTFAKALSLGGAKAMPP